MAMRRFLVPAAGYGAALLVGLIAAWASGVWSAGLSGADEPAHFLNTFVVARYLAVAPGSNPMAFAAEFYLHYPKISIGHWPPAYYAALAPFLLIFGASPATAFALNLFAAALPAAGVAWLLARLGDARAGLAGAILWALTPAALEGQAFFMLDQPLAALVLFAAIAWLLYAERQTWPRILAFALLAAAAVLVKGNGWLLALFPACHIAIAGRWRLLDSAKPWLAAALAAALVVPWYWLTAGIAAEGFNYAPGPAYAARALLYNLGALNRNVTPVGLALAAFALFDWHRRRREDARGWTIVSGCAALILATLALQSLIPADLDDRYIAPALPPLVVLALAGAVRLAARWRAAAALALVLAIPGLVHLAAREPKLGFAMEEIAARAAPGAWLIDGNSGAEGAFVAAMAVRDPGLAGYTVRASKLLADSDFMGTRYRLRYAAPGEALAELHRLGLTGIVLVRTKGVERPAHSVQLERALALPGSGYRLAWRVPHRGRAGVTLVYLPTAPATPNIAAIRALGLPASSRRLAGE
jgi:4-amino-4-deoxy-L-arabinose transferase-like glycosyltransferase